MVFWLLFYSIMGQAQMGPLDPTREVYQLRRPSYLVEDKTASLTARYLSRNPYVPQIWDYGLEFGSMWNHDGLYWLGMDVGRHVGTCIFSQSQHCQQYVDFILGVGGRESQTHLMGLGSLRWQFVNFPSSWSTVVRVLFGGANSVLPGETKQNIVYGVGFGMTTYIHPHVDLRFEVRYLQADHGFVQTVISAQLKIDQWLEYFGGKIKGAGVDSFLTTGKAVRQTGSVIKKTIDVTSGVVSDTAGKVRRLIPYGSKPDDREPAAQEDEKQPNVPGE